MQFKTKEFWIIFPLLIATGIYTTLLRYSQVSPREQVNLESFPEQFADWNTVHTYIMDSESENVLKANQYIWRMYENTDGRRVTLFLSYFKDQKYGAQIHSPKHCLPGGGWKIVAKNSQSLRCDRDGQSFVMNKLSTARGNIKDTMFYWFWTRSGVIKSELGLKADLARNALARKPTDASFVRFNLQHNENNPDEDFQVVANFFNSSYQYFSTVLPFHI